MENVINLWGPIKTHPLGGKGGGVRAPPARHNQMRRATKRNPQYQSTCPKDNPATIIITTPILTPLWDSTSYPIYDLQHMMHLSHLSCLSFTVCHYSLLMNHVISLKFMDHAMMPCKSCWIGIQVQNLFMMFSLVEGMLSTQNAFHDNANAIEL